MKKALVTGLSGQDGWYLANFLAQRGCEVYGTIRRQSNGAFRSQGDLLSSVRLIYADLADDSSLLRALEISSPDEIYNLAAQSFVGASWTLPEVTCDVTGLGVLRLLEAVRRVCPGARVYQASSSEMFGLSTADYQNELTPFYPRSPYGAAKVFAHNITVNYRESFGLYACCGILFNHESPRRGPEFVTRKIAAGVASIKRGETDTLVLGNLDSRRDWGYAPDYVEAMWLMLQQDEPEDYVIGTGEARSVREFAEAAFAAAGLDWRDHVTVSQALMRPAEVPFLRADARKAKNELQWSPSTRFHSLVDIMVKAELESLSTGTERVTADVV
jgi:GDPmannose 4,6-dehydratase